MWDRLRQQLTPRVLMLVAGWFIGLAITGDWYLKERTQEPLFAFLTVLGGGLAAVVFLFPRLNRPIFPKLTERSISENIRAKNRPANSFCTCWTAWMKWPRNSAKIA